MVSTLEIWALMFNILTLADYCVSVKLISRNGNLTKFLRGLYGVTQDQTSTRVNTLLDDADDIQRQLDNEARDRIQLGRPKTIWVFHLPSQFPEISTEALSRNPARQKAKVTCLKKTEKRRTKPISKRKSKVPSAANWEYSEQGINSIFSIVVLSKAGYVIGYFLGQHNWSAIYPECGGRSQSPVDLPSQGLVKARAGRQLVFSNYDAMPESLNLRDDGKRLTLYGRWKPGHRPLIYGGAAHSRRYLFHSLALHWPSEHFVGGFQYPIESQVIHISPEYKSLAEAIAASERDPLAILGISNLYMFGNSTQTCLKELLKASADLGIGSKAIRRRPLSAFSPPFKEYVTYQGSLTAPPCTESVLWLVRARSLTLTRALGKMANDLLAPGGEPRRNLLRHPQPRNDRKIFFFT